MDAQLGRTSLPSRPRRAIWVKRSQTTTQVARAPTTLVCRVVGDRRAAQAVADRSPTAATRNDGAQGLPARVGIGARRSSSFVTTSPTSDCSTRGEHRRTFRAAMPFPCFPGAATEIPFDGVTMTGYLFPGRVAMADRDRPCSPRAATTRPPRPATSRPATWLWPAVCNFFVFEGPGQGGMLYEHRIPMRPDFEGAVRGGLRLADRTGGVDPDRVAVVGRSFGGYLGPRAAAFEPRVAALVADQAIRLRHPDDQDVWRRRAVEKVTDADPDTDAQLEALDDPATPSGTGHAWRRWGRPRSASSSAASSPSTSATVSARFRARR